MVRGFAEVFVQCFFLCGSRFAKIPRFCFAFGEMEWRREAACVGSPEFLSFILYVIVAKAFDQE